MGQRDDRHHHANRRRRTEKESGGLPKAKSVDSFAALEASRQEA